MLMQIVKSVISYEGVLNLEKNENTSSVRCESGGFCVGYGFVPVQNMGDVYSSSEALAAGTVFPELALTIDEYGAVCKATGGAE